MAGEPTLHTLVSRFGRRSRCVTLAVVPLSPRDKRLTLVACILGSVIVFLDQTVVNVALPALRRDLDAGLSAQQWVIDAYLLSLASLLLVGGSLGDRLGRRRVFTVGLVGFGATSLLCAVAPSAWLLCAGRGLQGVAGALLVPGSLALITATFDAEERGRAIGTWTAWTGVAFVLGPLLGGFLIDAVSWRWIFAINVPLVAVTLLLVARAIPEAAREEGERPGIDVVGALLVSLGLAAPVFALIEQPRRGFEDPLVVAPLVLGVGLLAAFVAWERRAGDPMVPLELFRRRNFAVVNLVSLLFYAGLAGMTFFLVLFLQQVAGYSALEAGLALVPITVMMFVLSRRFGGLADRIGSRRLMAAGPLVAGSGVLLMTRLDSSADYLSTLLPALLLFGFGLSMTVAPLTSTVLAAAPERLAGTASGINNAMTRVAALLAIAALGAVVSGRFVGVLEESTSGQSLSSEQRAALVEIRSRPLSGVESSSLSGAERLAVERPADEASEAAFRLGIGVCALLLVGGGLLSAFGLRDGRAATRDDAVRTSHPAGADEDPSALGVGDPAPARSS